MRAGKPDVEQLFEVSHCGFEVLEVDEEDEEDDGVCCTIR
jgi:hypothetical protein